MRTAAVLLLTLAVTACNRGPNPSDEANKALKDAHLDSVSLEWDRGARVGHLKGLVDTPTDRQRAEQVAAAAVGTTGQVVNEVTIKGVNDATAGDFDGQIKKTLKKMVENDTVLSHRDIDFEVNNGVVTVKGEVESAAEKSKVTELVHAAPGVKDMANALVIKVK